MNENEQIEKVAKELYKKYKPAFDLVYKYASPSSSTLVPHNIEELIKNENSIRPFSTSKTYVRFQPNFLYDNIQKLKEKGFIAQEDNLTDSWLFLFEFHITRTYIYFDMKIGEYHDSSCREKLYNLLIQNKEIFNKVEKANGQLRPAWHQAFQKKIVTTSEYNKFLESEAENMDDKIEKGFHELIKDDLTIIQKVIEEAIEQ